MVKFSKKNKYKKNKLVKFKPIKLSKRKKYLNIPSHNVSNKITSKDLRLSTRKNVITPRSKKVFIGGASTQNLNVIELAWNSLKNEFEAPNKFMPDYQLNKKTLDLINKYTTSKSKTQSGGSAPVPAPASAPASAPAPAPAPAPADNNTSKKNNLFNWTEYGNMCLKSKNTLILLGYFKIGIINKKSSIYEIIKNNDNIDLYNNVLAYNDMTGTHIVNLSEHLGNIKLHPEYETHLKTTGLLNEDGTPTDKGKECLDEKTQAIKDTSKCSKYNSSKASGVDLAKSKHELEHLISLKKSDDDNTVLLSIDADIDLSDDTDIKDNEDQVQKVLDDINNGLKATSKLEGDVVTVAKEAANDAALVAISQYIKSIDTKQKEQLQNIYNKGKTDGAKVSYEDIANDVHAKLKNKFDQTVNAKVAEHKEETSAEKEEIEKQEKKLEKALETIKNQEKNLQQKQDSIKEDIENKEKLLQELKKHIKNLKDKENQTELSK